MFIRVSTPNEDATQHQIIYIIAAQTKPIFAFPDLRHPSKTPLPPKKDRRSQPAIIQRRENGSTHTWLRRDFRPPLISYRARYPPPLVLSSSHPPIVTFTKDTFARFVSRENDRRRQHENQPVRRIDLFSTGEHGENKPAPSLLPRSRRQYFEA